MSAFQPPRAWPPAGNRDTLAMLQVSNHDRIKTLIPLRHSRMLESPFAFFRGSAIVQANDLAAMPISGIRVQASATAI
jgi:uncharacterized protein (DUF2252 family)